MIQNVGKVILIIAGAGYLFLQFLHIYFRGYKDGEAAERERSEARQTAHWEQFAQAEFVYICSGCGCIKIGPRGAEYLWKYCSNCGARMISGGEEEA